MALPPTIPTSFVPRSQTPRPERLDLMGAFFFAGIGILAVALIAAGAVFGYQYYLGQQKAAGDALVAHDEQSIDPSVIESFVRLQQRIDTASSLISGHIILSQLFTLIEQLTPANVRLTGLSFVAQGDDMTTYTLSASGSAKSFNALAVASASFSASPLLRNIIFSNLALAQDGTVTFVVNADVDPRLVSLAAASSTPDLGAPATTTSTSTSSPQTSP